MNNVTDVIAAMFEIGNAHIALHPGEESLDSAFKLDASVGGEVIREFVRHAYEQGIALQCQVEDNRVIWCGDLQISGMDVPVGTLTHIDADPGNDHAGGWIVQLQPGGGIGVAGNCGMSVWVPPALVRASRMQSIAFARMTDLARFAT